MPLTSLLFGLAFAASAPAILPSRDVTVAYRLQTPGRPDQDYVLEYDAPDQRARITSPGLPSYFLVDLPSGAAQLVVPQLHSIVAAPDLSDLSQQITDVRDHASFTGAGGGQYAGLGCNNWLIHSGYGKATACLTVNGVTLHFEGSNAHGAATLTATAVSFGLPPATDFSAPAGYAHVTLPPAILRQLIGAG